MAEQRSDVDGMTLDEYLEQFIEGYLLGDLEAMALIQPPPGKAYGTVGYPMVMTVVSGIEVLGVLTSTTSFNKDNGAARFGQFWNQYMYADRPAIQRLDSVVYEFLRHPLAHSFMTRPMIVVTKRRERQAIFRRSDDVICVDALTLADDFGAAYERLRPQIVGALKATMETRFRELREAFWKEYEANKHKVAKVPVSVSLFFDSTKPMEQTGVTGGIYSINASAAEPK